VAIAPTWDGEVAKDGIGLHSSNGPGVLNLRAMEWREVALRQSAPADLHMTGFSTCCVGIATTRTRTGADVGTQSDLVAALRGHPSFDDLFRTGTTVVLDSPQRPHEGYIRRLLGLLGSVELTRS
jgi:hypothetical protein